MKLLAAVLFVAMSTPAFAGPLLPLRCAVDASAAASASIKVEAGDKAMRFNKLKKAHGLYEEALALDPCSNHVWTRYGSVMLELGEPDSARRALGRAIALDNSSARTWSLFAQAAEDLGNWDAANRSWAKALALHPGLSAAESGLARVAKQMKNDDTMVSSR